MKKNLKKIILILILLALIVIGGIVLANKKKIKNVNVNDNKQTEENTPKVENKEKDEIPEKEQEQIIEEIKEDLGATGDNTLYEVKQGYDNQKTISIKSSVKYKVAFAGIIKDRQPNKNELDEIMEENHPPKAGIWIYEKDRKNFLDLLKNITKSEYEITSDGYLNIVDIKNTNENDKKIQKIINGDKLFVIRISSICYIIDDITGEILDYNFEQIDEYQTYEYFKDEDKMIIFITQNKEKQLEEKEIIQSIIDLM